MSVNRVCSALLVALLMPAATRAQMVIAPTEHLAFDRPEAWALQYFTSATFLTPFDPTTPERPGSVGVQLEAGWLPPLSAAQQQVGFAGTTAEDLNKAPVFVRPRVRVAVSDRVAITFGGVPPLRAWGVTPRLVSLGVDWAVVDRGEWRLTLRAHGQTGTVTGAFTCPDAVLAFAPGSPGNPNGCMASSADMATLRYGALEASVARRLTEAGGVIPHVAIALNGLDNVFQVDARTFGNIDHTRLETNGVTWSLTAGASLRLGSHVDGSADVLYTPLAVRRVATEPSTTDSLFTIRGLITVWIRK